MWLLGSHATKYSKRWFQCYEVPNVQSLNIQRLASDDYEFVGLQREVDFSIPNYSILMDINEVNKIMEISVGIALY